MSPRRQPPSLYQYCLAHISSLLDMLAHRPQRNPITINPEIVLILECIKLYLPSSVQEAIGNSIVDHNSNLLQNLLPSHVKILLNLRVRKLSLSGSVLDSEVLEGEDASRLDRLSLFYCGSSTRATKLYRFLSTSSSLTHLTCTDFCNDAMLDIIASSCHNLYCLDLRGCDVTDDGMLKLCGFQHSLHQCIDILSTGGRLIPVSRIYKTLREIKLSMTKVTEAGVAIILLVLTNIYLLRVPDIPMEKLFTFLKRIDHKEVQCNLKEFHTRMILDESQISVLIGICPNLEYIQMSFVGNIEVDLIRLQKLTRLKNLTGAKFADVNTDALMVFLAKMGNQLRSLFLYTYRTNISRERLKITHTHLWNLARCCSNLKILILEGYNLDNDSLPMTCDMSSLQFFRNLHTLKLFSMNLSDEDLKVFLCKCTNMKTLELALKDPHVLHDRLVEELLDEGVWKNLTKVNIKNSPITSKVMCRLVYECPQLQTLGSLFTWLVAKDQVIDFKKMVRKQNLDIELY